MLERLLAAGLSALITTAAFVTLFARDVQRRPPAGLATAPRIVGREEIALAGDRIRADRWYDDVLPPSEGQAMRQDRRNDMNLILQGLRHPIPELRAAALREMGRFELADNARLIAPLLADPAELVRRAAADALVQTLWDKKEDEAAPFVELLDQYILQVRSVATLTSFWMAIAELPLDVKTAQKYEARFINEIRQATPQRFAALEALLVLTQHRRGRPLMPETEDQVKELARKGLDQGDPNVMVGLTSLGPTIRYLEILQSAQADADDIAFDAASFFCRKTEAGCGQDIRRLGVYLLNPSNPKHVPVLLEAARDRKDIRTTATAIRQLIKSPEVTRCSLLDLAWRTPAEPDVILALAERRGECGDWSPVFWLTQQATNLISSTQGRDWVAPAAALVALDRLAPDAARPIAIDVATGHGLWQARAAAVRVAGKVRDRELVLKLASDKDANVRTALLETLLESRSPYLFAIAVGALADLDVQVVRTAAIVLKGHAVAEGVTPLFEALRRLTEGGRDTSRRARLALLERIAEFLPGGAPDTPERLTALESYLRDFDPLVAKAAADLLRKSSSAPVIALPRHRPAVQPSVPSMRGLPPCVVIALEGEASLTVVLNRAAAPVAAARFIDAVLFGTYTSALIYWDDEQMTEFGDRTANDEGFWLRFARHEPGTAIEPMSLTLRDHGPDTADGRLGIRWHANPELNRRETVIGRGYLPPPPANSGNVLEGLQLGKVIRKISVGGEGRLAAAGPGDPCNPRAPW